MSLSLSDRPTEIMVPKKLDYPRSLMLEEGSSGSLVPVRGELARQRFHIVLMTGQATLQEGLELRYECVNDGWNLGLMSGTRRWLGGVIPFLFLLLFPKWPHWINHSSLPFNVVCLTDIFRISCWVLFVRAAEPRLWPWNDSNKVFSPDGHLYHWVLFPRESWQSSKF